MVARGLLDEFAGKTAIGEKEMHDTMVEFQTAVVTERGANKPPNLAKRTKKRAMHF